MDMARKKYRTRPMADRFYEKVNKSGPVPIDNPSLGPCWLWMASKKQGNYGQFSVPTGSRLAHVVAYEMEVGPVPEGKILDHKCRVHDCVNPSHLRPVTLGENSQNRSTITGNKWGYRGIRWVKAWNKYQGSVMVAGTRHHTGGYETADEAAEALRVLRCELQTHNDCDRK
jgi:hypothetical protein